jgi:hypothetical protein
MKASSGSMLITGLLALCLSGGTKLHAQMKVFSNGVEVKPGQELKWEDIKALTVTFANAKKIPEYTTGVAVVYAQLNYNDAYYGCNFFFHSREGYTAVSDFLYKSIPEEVLVNEDRSKVTLTAEGCPTNDGYQHLRSMLNSHQNDAAYQKVKVTVGLYFRDKLGYNKYGDRVPLLEPFTFYIQVWDGSMTLPGTGMKFKATEAGYKSAGENSLNLEGAWLHVTNIDAPDGKGEEQLSQLKTAFENYLGYYANQSNGKKTLKQFGDIETNFWKQNRSLHDFSNTDILYTLDQKQNPSYAQAMVWEKVNYKKISGYRFQSLRYYVTDRHAIGLTVMYLFRDPSNPSKVLLFTHSESGGTFTEEKLKKVIPAFEKFFSAIE